MINRMIIKIESNLQRNLTTVIILCSIAFSESIKLNLLIFFNSLSGITESLNNFWLTGCFIGPIFLGWISDRFLKHSLRKPTAILSMLFSCITFLLIIYLDNSNAIYKFLALFNGLCGTYLGVARAFVLDQQSRENRLMAFILTIVFQCITWVVVGNLFINKILTLDRLTVFNAVLFPVIILLSVFFTSDPRRCSEEAKSSLIELKLLFKKYGDFYHLGLLLSFLFLSLSYHLMPYLIDYVAISKSELLFKSFSILGIGVGIGAAFASFIKAPTKIALPLGYGMASLLLLGMSYLHWADYTTNNFFSWPTILLFSTIGGTLWVITLKDFLDRASLSEDGAIFGVFEAFQSAGEIMASLVISYLLPKILLKHHANSILLVVVLLAFFAILIPKLKNLRQ